MLEIEFENPNISVCECCGGKTTRLTRFVHKDGNAFAIYYLSFTDNHPDKSIIGIISIGDWGSDGPPKNRKSFPFKIWTNEKNYQIGLIDKIESPWQDALLGEILNRNEALKHNWIKDVFHITDHIVAEDILAIEYLNQSNG
ncbi:hypothetical protein HYN48_14185 [Flavobacterium magnum]|uniref:Uncharacterized protein n=1 Tax=Flavobacterium magnum TaxID=2162713 RepID=A0A2S0RHY3_9FLAO|nr:hypothetical protein [Flavobacterium magnum]AWA31149.1 hypothetical protein HYN48_14185 [Flavobacterium magnum]